jgi:UDP-glucose 4-epimerase
MTVLVTGGTGFIGSHTVVELLSLNHEVIIVDNLSNSNHTVLEGIEKITNKKPLFYENNVNNKEELKLIFKKHKIDGVIHFAASKAVGESVEKPLLYYKNNLLSTLVVLELCIENACQNFVFSSSCTVYGNPDTVPVTEETPRKKAESPYGNTKNICEDILEDLNKSKAKIKTIALRYFNPVGAHESGEIGELPIGKPQNLIPVVTQSAIGKIGQLTVNGTDYDTVDGSNVRDYIHVVDLAKAHLAALNYLNDIEEDNFHDVFNLGSGAGNTVIEVINTFEKVNGVKVPHVYGPRRSGDVVQIYGNVNKAKQKLNWQTQKSLEDALRDAWKWENKIANNKI